MECKYCNYINENNVSHCAACGMNISKKKDLTNKHYFIQSILSLIYGLCLILIIMGFPIIFAFFIFSVVNITIFLIDLAIVIFLIVIRLLCKKYTNKLEEECKKYIKIKKE